MLWKSNVLALVGATRSPRPSTDADAAIRYDENLLVLYDLERNCALMEFTFQDPIKNCKLTQKRLLVSTEHKIFVYELFRGTEGAAFPLVTKDYTRNPHGLLGCSTIRNEKENIRFVYAFPHPENEGYVCINYEDEQKHFVKYALSAHSTSALYALAVSCSGKRLATASDHGTVIRIFNVLTGKELQLLRRGSEFAKIYSMGFRASDGRFLIVASDKPTVHIFEVAREQGGRTRNSSNFLRNGEYAFATWRNPADRIAMAPAVPFFSKDGGHVFVLSTEKKEMFRLKFDGRARKVHEMKLLNYKRFN